MGDFADSRRLADAVNPVAEKLEANPEDPVAKEKCIFVKGSPEREMTLPEAIKSYRHEDLPMPIVGRGSWMGLATEPATLLKENGNFAPNYSFVTQTAEMEVDLETGRVKLLRMVTAHDCGRTINPILV